MYYGCNVIFQTNNGGQSWKVISPDLSTQDPSKIMPSGGIVGDNLGQFAPEVIFAIATSEVEKGLIWAGTNDGKVWYTRDGGAKWNDVSKNITGMPAWGIVSKIEPSHFNGGTAYIAVDDHLMDSREPYIFKTTDYGATWKRVNGDLPNKHPLSYVKAVAENPNKQGMLFAGTGHGFYYSTDDGGHWTEVSAGLPHAPVSWVVVQKQFHDVVVSTYGRGLYVLDDITPLEQGGPATTDAARAVHAAAGLPLDAARPRDHQLLVEGGADAVPVQLQMLDAEGTVVRELRTTAREGLNRATWDLRYEPPRLVAMRTTPPENPHIWEEPRFRGQDTRPVTHWGLDQAQVGPIVAPGKYTVKLTVDGQSFTQPLEILRDPKIATSVADLDLSVRLQLRLRDNISAAADMVNTIEVMRKQLEDVQKAYRNDATKDGAAQAGRRDGQEAVRRRGEAARAGADDERRQVLPAGLSRLHEPDLAERRSRPGRGRRLRRRRFPADRHVGRRAGDDREGSERREGRLQEADGPGRAGVQPRDRRRDDAAHYEMTGTNGGHAGPPLRRS